MPALTGRRTASETALAASYPGLAAGILLPGSAEIGPRGPVIHNPQGGGNDPRRRCVFDFDERFAKLSLCRRNRRYR